LSDDAVAILAYEITESCLFTHPINNSPRRSMAVLPLDRGGRDMLDFGFGDSVGKNRTATTVAQFRLSRHIVTDGIFAGVAIL
jgi:hypothetical protein